MPTKVSQRKSSSGTCTSKVKRTRSASDAKTHSDDKTSEHQFELLQYDWPDLPPIAEMKDAVCRQSVSRGISYLLPVDRGLNSVNGRYRTDLRAMFQEPYIFDDRMYKDSVIGLSSRVHFLTNQSNSRWTSQLARSVPIEINSASDIVRKSYSRSAPVNGARRGLGYGLAPSRVHGLPLISHVQKAELSPEIVILKQEAEEMIKQSLAEIGTVAVREKGQVSADNLTDQTVSCEPNWSALNHCSPLVGGQTGNVSSETRDDSQADSTKPSTKQSYEEFCTTVSKKCKVNRIPERFASPYLEDERNQEIWAWLHHGETISEFDYFMSLCG